MDEETKNALFDAAKSTLRMDYEFSDDPIEDLIRIHEWYLNRKVPEVLKDFRASQTEYYADYTTDAEVEKAEKATAKYKAALQDCGAIGAAITDQIVVRATGFISGAKKHIDRDKRFYREFGFKEPFSPKRGKPEDLQLRAYIFDMAKWYIRYTNNKPGSGTSSIFANLIRECLPKIDETRKEPSNRFIKSVVQNMEPGAKYIFLRGSVLDEKAWLAFRNSEKQGT